MVASTRPFDMRAIQKHVLDRKLVADTGYIPPGLQLIRDTWDFEVTEVRNDIMEGVNGLEQPVMKVSGLFQLGDQENANGRMYPTSDVLVPAVKQIQEDVSKRAVLGEYDHPADAKIHLDRVSHLITKIWMEGKKVYGEAEVLHELPHGACLRGLFKHKTRVGISSRGVGDMEVVEGREGASLHRVMPGYSFVTWDVVAEPSVTGAILQIQEGLHRHLRQESPKRKFSQQYYQTQLVREINKFFGQK